MKFQVGDPVFFYTMIDRIPGIIEGAEQDENGRWVYVIRVSDTMFANNVYEHKVEARNIVEAPKYNRGDEVRFITSKNVEYVGVIEIVDPYLIVMLWTLSRFVIEKCPWMIQVTGGIETRVRCGLGG